MLAAATGSHLPQVKQARFVKRTETMKHAVVVDCVRTPIGRAHASQGVFRDVPESSLPDFLGFISSSSVGFSEPFINENNLYVVRVFGFSEAEKQTLENSYEFIYNFTRSSLIEEKIVSIINKHKQKIYTKTFY